MTVQRRNAALSHISTFGYSTQAALDTSLRTNGGGGGGGGGGSSRVVAGSGATEPGIGRGNDLASQGNAVRSDKPTKFKLGSFNVLGSSHTAPGGNKASRPSGPARMKLAVQGIKKHDLDVVGLQEFEPNQCKAFQRLTHNEFGVYPGNKVKGAKSANSIAWRKDKFELVKARTVKIPYFGGHKVRMPVILLKDKKTGQKMYVMNFHNPADTKSHHHQERFRDAATRIETALVNRLRRRTGLPVLMTGDMNEKEEFRRHVRQDTNMRAAMSGKNSHSHKVGIDWIFGSPDVNFSGYNRDTSSLIRRASDHPMIYSNVTIPPRRRRA